MGKALSVVALAVLVAGCGSGRSVDRPTTKGPPRTTASTAGSASGEPSLIFGVTVSGQPPNQTYRLLAISSASGQVVRTLATSPPHLDAMQPGTMSEVAPSPDRSLIYMDYAVGGSCAGQVVSVPASGGRMSPLDPDALKNPPADSTGYAGGAPAVSPDGKQVIWLRQICHPTAPPPGGYEVPIITQVATHEGEVVNLQSFGLPLSWDGSGGALLMGNDNSGTERVYKLTPQNEMKSVVTIRAPDAHCTLEDATFMPGQDKIAAVENCLHPGTYGGNRLVELHAATGTMVTTLTTLAPDRSFGSISFDQTGAWLLYQQGPGGSDRRPTLYVLHDGRTTSLVTSVPIYDAVW